MSAGLIGAPSTSWTTRMPFFQTVWASLSPGSGPRSRSRTIAGSPRHAIAPSRELRISGRRAMPDSSSALRKDRRGLLAVLAARTAGCRYSTISSSLISLRAHWIAPTPMHSSARPRQTPGRRSRRRNRGRRPGRRRSRRRSRRRRSSSAKMVESPNSVATWRSARFSALGRRRSGAARGARQPGVGDRLVGSSTSVASRRGASGCRCSRLGFFLVLTSWVCARRSRRATATRRADADEPGEQALGRPGRASRA